MHMKNLAKWSRTVPIPNKDNLISSHARANNEKGFTPTYENEGRPNMHYLMNFEYRRMWFKERGQYEKEVYTKKEMMKEESKIKRRYVQRVMVPNKKEKTLPIIRLKRKSPSQIIVDFIKKDTIAIFSKSYCKYCKQAKELLAKMNKTYATMELDRKKDSDVIQNQLERMTGARTVPRIFVNGVCIGGASDLEELYISGKWRDVM